MDDGSELDAMRQFVSALLRGERPPGAPPTDLVRQHLLAPMAYRMGLRAFRDDYAASVIMAERRATVLAEVAARLHRSGVRLALIKGVAYAGVLYPDPAERPMQDIDILVPRSQVAAAMECMVDLGFRRGSAARTLSSSYHAVTFVRSGTMVDLHRDIVQQGRTGLRIDDLWRRAAPDPRYEGAGRLEDVDGLLLCALHIARHELAVPILNYVDVARSWARLDEAGRDELLRRARQYRARRPVTAVLAMTDLLSRGRTGRPRVGAGEHLLPTSDQILLGVKPRRLEQVARKVVLTEGLREVAGLTFAFGRSVVDGWRQRLP